MARQPRAGLRPGAIPHLTLLRIDGVTLALAQNEIHTIEPVLDLQAGAPGCAGVILLGEERWPVFNVSQALTALHPMPASRRMCVLLQHPRHRFGIACDGAASVRSEQVRTLPLPPVAVLADTPIHGLGVYEEGLVCLTSASALAEHIRRWASAAPLLGLLDDEPAPMQAIAG